MSAEKPKLRHHTNQEKVRECPYCGKEVLSRGLYTHVFSSDDDIHGERETVPDGFNVQDAEIVGKQEVTVINPTAYSIDHRRFVCRYCGDSFRGELGITIHLDRKCGTDEIHPETDEGIDLSSFESFPATPDNQVIVDTEEQAKRLEDTNVSSILITEGDESAQQLIPDQEAEYPPAEDAIVPISELKDLRAKFLKDEEQGRTVTPYHASERILTIIEKYEN